MTFKINSKIKRGNESKEHLFHKLNVADMLKQADYDLITIEENRCDVTGIKAHEDYSFKLAVEIQHSTKNIHNNIKRNLRSGYDFNLIVCSSNQITSRVKRLIDKANPIYREYLISVNPINEINPDLLKNLASRYSNKIKRDESNSLNSQL